jgi:hypothetical protein
MISSNPGADQPDTPVREVIGSWVKTPRSYLDFFKQRNTILEHPDVLCAQGTTNLGGWSSPLAYSLKSGAIMVLIVQGFIFLLSATGGGGYYGRAGLTATVEASSRSIATQIAKTEQNRDDIRNAPSETRFSFIDSPDSLSQQDADTRVSTQLAELRRKDASAQQSLNILTWEGRINSAWQSIVLPLTLILAAYRCRQKIAWLGSTALASVDSLYLYLSTSHTFFPMILGSILFVLYQPVTTSNNGLAQTIFWVASVISGFWYYYSLDVVGTRMSTETKHVSGRQSYPPTLSLPLSGNSHTHCFRESLKAPWATSVRS